MKALTKILTIVLLFCSTLILTAQTPQGFNYQAVIKDASGDVLANTSANTQIEIRETSATGTVIYSEIHDINTNAQGLIAVVIGEGITTDDFSVINWSSGVYFMEVSVDVNSDGTYTSLGTQQLVSVPYALHAQSTNAMTDSDGDTKIELFENTKDTLSVTVDGVKTLEFLNNRIVIDHGNPGNIFIGDNSGTDAPAIGNGNNIAIGNNAMNTITSGFQNLAIGSAAMFNTSPGIRDNVALGIRAGYEMRGGSNTVIGDQALRNAGRDNTAVGKSAGDTGSGNSNFTIGDYNTYLGSFAGVNNYNSNGNTFLGAWSGSNATGDYNIFLGAYSGQSYDGDNTLIVDNTFDSSPLITGKFDTDEINLNADVTVRDTLFIPNRGIKFADGSFQNTSAAPDNLGNHTLTQSLITGAQVFRSATTSASTFLLTNQGAFVESTAATGRFSVAGFSSSNIEMSTDEINWTLELSNAKFAITGDDSTSDVFTIDANTTDTSLEIKADGEVAHAAGISIGGGTKVTKYDANTYDLGANAGGGILTATINFDNAFTSIPIVTATVKSGVATEMYTLNIISATTTSVTVAVYRIDNGGGTWTTDLDIQWTAQTIDPGF